MKKNQNTHIDLNEAINRYIKKDNSLKMLMELFTYMDNIYIVGGFLRDILLNKEPRDIDFLFYGPLDKYLDEITMILGGDYRYNARFMTGTLELDGRIFDFATTRCEKYSKPGVLPVVQRCPLKMDFKRRDFTINAVVWDIKNQTLIDPLKGLKDIENRILRLTYKNSFIDDPTRMIRGVRFAGKYSLKIDKETVRCYNSALKKDSFSTISASRLKGELDLIFMERSFVNISLLVNKMGLFQFVNANITDIYPYIDEKEKFCLNRDFFILSCLGDLNVKRAYPREWGRLNRMSKLNKKQIFNVYKRFGDTDLLLYLMSKGKNGVTSYKILKKLREFDKLKISGMIRKFNPKLPKERYFKAIKEIANMYLESKLKNGNDIKKYISRMEV